MSNSGCWSLKEYLSSRRMLVDDALEGYLPTVDTYPPVMFESIRYSIFAGGKRLRPILCIAGAEAVGGEADTVLPIACALEMIHTYSLVHDDLPAMDDDDFRRGVPTNHKVFGEGIATLAGDALLTEAFRLMAAEGGRGGTVAADRLIAVIGDIAAAAGCMGMVGGQVADLVSEGTAVDPGTLEYIHTRKTERLLSVSVRSGACLVGANESALASLDAYGKNIGLAFQIVDDLLDIEGDPALMGKQTGSDEAKRKATYPSLFGIAASRAKSRELVDAALAALEHFDDAALPLRAIARHVVERSC